MRYNNRKEISHTLFLKSVTEPQLTFAVQWNTEYVAVGWGKMTLLKNTF